MSTSNYAVNAAMIAAILGAGMLIAVVTGVPGDQCRAWQHLLQYRLA